MQIRVPMKINSEKKHSIRYDAVASNSAIQSVYVMKSAMPNVGYFIDNIVVTIEKGE